MDSMNSAEVLNEAIRCGILDMEAMQQQIEMKKKEGILKQHPYKIWQGKDGKWYTYLPDDTKGRRKVKKSTQADIESLVVHYYNNQDEIPKTFDDMYRHWREIQDFQVSDNTIAKYNTDYKRYFKNTDFASKEIVKMTEEDIKVFICSTVKEQKLCKKACKTLFLYIKNVMYSARVNRLVSEDIMQFLAAKQFYKYCTEKELSKNTRLVSDIEMRKLYERFYEDYEKNPAYIPTYAVHLATLTGMRVGELSALTWECITDKYILINKSEKYDRLTKEYFVDKTKNGKDRSFPLTPQIKDLLDRVKKVEMQNGFICEWVFADKNGRIHAPIISSCSKNKCRQLGITEKGIHAYRRTVNSKMRCNGVSSTVASALLGHTEEVNDHYYTFDVSDLAEKCEIVSKINADISIAK